MEKSNRGVLMPPVVVEISLGCNLHFRAFAALSSSKDLSPETQHWNSLA